jgi:hypothetical protein
MANRKRRPSEERATASEAVISALALELKPEPPITASEFVRRAFRSGAVEKIEIQKMSGGTWSWAEDVGELTAGFNPESVAAYITDRFGRRRYRLGAVVDGQIVAFHLLNIDGWQDAEVMEKSKLPTSPILTSASRPVEGGTNISQIVAALNERVAVESAVAALNGVQAKKETETLERDTAPMRMMTEMMTGMMGLAREVMAARQPVPAMLGADPFTQFLLSQVTSLQERLSQPPKERDPGAMFKLLDTINDVLVKSLNTTLPALLTGAKDDAPSGMMGVIQGVMAGLQPHIEDILGLLKARASQPAAPRRADVIPFPYARRVELPATATPEETTVAQTPGLPPEWKAVVDALVDALMTKNFRTVDAFLNNPPLRGQINLDPEVPASAYVAMLQIMDPRFKDLGPAIAEYLLYLQKLDADADDEA